MFSLPTSRDRRHPLDDLTLTDGLEDQTADCTGNAISVTEPARLLDTSWTTRVTENNTLITATHLTRARERTKAKDEAKAKARKAKIEKEAEEEHHLATLVAPTIDILIAHRNPLTKIINLHSHHAMMGYVGIVINPGTQNGTAQNW